MKILRVIGFMAGLLLLPYVLVYLFQDLIFLFLYIGIFGLAATLVEKLLTN